MSKYIKGFKDKAYCGRCGVFYMKSELYDSNKCPNPSCHRIVRLNTHYRRESRRENRKV